MKKTLLLLAALPLITLAPLSSQGLLNKVKKAVTKEILGTGEENSGRDQPENNPEPSCACDDATLVVDLGIFKIDYREITISVRSDGSILLKERIGDKYYVAKDGEMEGPFEVDNPRVKEFGTETGTYSQEENGIDAMLSAYPQYISRTGEKYIIKFSGKSYGPYGIISDFAVSGSGGKFAAVVTKEVMVSETESKKLEEQMNNAKTDQEKMDIAMKLSQQMQNKMMQGGGPGALQPELISNVDGAKYDAITWMGGSLNSKIKFGEIVVVAPDKIIDLQGKTLFKLKPGEYGSDMFISSDNSNYAIYNAGTMTFSDNKTLSELFNPYVTKANGQTRLHYMYYSPSGNAIMQCSVQF